MAYVGVYFGVCGHVWYTFLDKRFPPKMPKAVLKKILAEAIVGPFYVSTIFFLMGKLQHHTAAQSWQNLQNNLVALFAVSILEGNTFETIVICFSLFKAEYLIFMPIQWLNFTYVPVKQRYLYVAIVSVIYDVFLSFILHRVSFFSFLFFSKLISRYNLERRLSKTLQSGKGRLKL